MRRWLMILVGVLVGTMVLVGCGSDETATTTSASVPSVSSTTGVEADAASTSTEVSPPVTTVSALDAYKLQMKEWRDKHEARMESATESLDALDNPLLASDEDIKGLKDFAGVLDDVGGDLKDIEPPADLSTAHADYVATFNDMAQALGQLAEALKDKSLEAVLAVVSAMEGVTEKGTAARAALEKALGFSLSGEDADQAAAGAGELGTRENPIPLGQEAQVGGWKVRVVEATLDATEVVLNHSEFNQSPEAGKQYVLIKLEAVRTGENAAAFWVDTYSAFVGSGGNTFEIGYADFPDRMSDTSDAYTGATVTGSLVFEVSSAQAVGGTLRLKEAFSLDDAEVFFAVD